MYLLRIIVFSRIQQLNCVGNRQSVPVSPQLKVDFARVFSYTFINPVHVRDGKWKLARPTSTRETKQAKEKKNTKKTRTCLSTRNGRQLWKLKHWFHAICEWNIALRMRAQSCSFVMSVRVSLNYVRIFRSFRISFSFWRANRIKSTLQRFNFEKRCDMPFGVSWVAVVLSLRIGVTLQLGTNARVTFVWATFVWSHFSAPQKIPLFCPVQFVHSMLPRTKSMGSLSILEKLNETHRVHFHRNNDY